MKITVTGSLGNIGKPLTEKLVQKGHDVTVISSKVGRQKDIEALGAEAAIGTLEDVAFLTSAFTGADAVYCMIPPGNHFDPNFDPIAWNRKCANNYKQAIQQSGVKQVIFLSGWVAGVIHSYQEIESIFNELSDISITRIRPGQFYSNFFDSMDMIKERNLIAAAFGGEDRVVFSAPSDIADAIVGEITHPHHDNKVCYAASDEMTCNEAAKIIGAAIGKPDLKWVTITDKELQRNMEMAGISPKSASVIVEMQVPIHKGLMAQEFSSLKPEAMGKIKMVDFAKEFAEVYNQQ